jgi:threonine dehydratase
MTATEPIAPTLAEIARARASLGARLRTTPVWEWRSERLPPRVHLKLELFQHGGSFKARGALAVMSSLPRAQRARGVVAVSAGNHAIATAWAARELGTTATVVMPKTADPFRVQCSRALGARIVLTDDVHRAFAETERIQRDEGRFFVHPFEGPLTALGTATLGHELLEQVPDLDAVIVPIGGGGLCAGVAAAIKQQKPQCRVIGVEPEGADSMHRSFASGKPERIDAVRTIADSLGAPYALPYSFALCRRYVDELVKVSDDELRAAMALLFSEAKLAVEPAGAASTAALLGPLRGREVGRDVGLIVCGANVDAGAFWAALEKGWEMLAAQPDRKQRPRSQR